MTHPQLHTHGRSSSALGDMPLEGLLCTSHMALTCHNLSFFQRVVIRYFKVTLKGRFDCTITSCRKNSIQICLYCIIHFKTSSVWGYSLTTLSVAAGMRSDGNESSMEANLSTEVSMVVLDIVCLYTSTFKVGASLKPEPLILQTISTSTGSVLTVTVQCWCLLTSHSLQIFWTIK